MKPTIAEVLAGAWPNLKARQEPRTLHHLAQVNNSSLAKWGYPLGLLLTLDKNATPAPFDLVLGWHHGARKVMTGCWLEESHCEVLVIMRSGLRSISAADWSTLGCFVSPKRYKWQPLQPGQQN